MTLMKIEKKKLLLVEQSQAKHNTYTKLRHHCILIYDLHKINIVESGNCQCGLPKDALPKLFLQ